MTTYPTFLAGQRLTASLLTSMLPAIAFKSADTSRAAQATTTDDLDLSLPVVANATYILTGYIAYTSAVITGDFKLNFNAPSLATGYWTAVAPGSASTADPDGVRTIATPVGLATRSYGVSTASIVFGAVIAGSVSTGATAGTLTTQWSQFTSDATATTVRAGSWIQLIRVI